MILFFPILKIVHAPSGLDQKSRVFQEKFDIYLVSTKAFQFLYMLEWKFSLLWNKNTKRAEVRFTKKGMSKISSKSNKTEKTFESNHLFCITLSSKAFNLLHKLANQWFHVNIVVLTNVLQQFANGSYVMRGRVMLKLFCARNFDTYFFDYRKIQNKRLSPAYHPI